MIKERVGARFLPNVVLHLCKRHGLVAIEGKHHSRRQKNVRMDQFCIRRLLLRRNRRKPSSPTHLYFCRFYKPNKNFACLTFQICILNLAHDMTSVCHGMSTPPHWEPHPQLEYMHLLWPSQEETGLHSASPSRSQMAGRDVYTSQHFQ